MGRVNVGKYFVFGVLFFCLFFANPISSQAKKHTKHVSSSQVKKTVIAEPKELGVGLVIGDPTGLTVQYWLDSLEALEFALGAQLASAGFGMHAQYLRYFRVFQEAPEVPVYVGGGLCLGGGSAFFFGVRGAVGISYIFEEPFDVFMELSPKILVAPRVNFDLGFSVGVRYYF